MNLRLLAFLTISISMVFVIFAFIFDIPLAYIPTGSTALETVVYYSAFLTIEVIISTFLLMHMLKKSNLDESICAFFDKKSNLQ